MDSVTTSLSLLHQIIEYSKHANFSKKRCTALGSRCATIRTVLENNSQNIIELSNIEKLNKYLTRVSATMTALSNRNSLTMMIRSCTEELDEIITELDSLIHEMNMQMTVELRDMLRRLELRYKAEKAEDDRELHVLLAENDYSLDKIREFLSLTDVHPFLQQIVEAISIPGHTDINRVATIVKRIERSEDDDPRLSNIKDVIREARGKGQDDSAIAKDIVSIVSDMVHDKDSLEPPDPKIDPKDLIVGKVLGSGAFGTIHEGTWQSKIVAIKVLKDLSAGNNKALEREVRAINILKDCSNIISLFGYCVDGNSQMIVMELAQNGSLFDFIHYNNAYHGMDDEQKHNLITGIAHGVAIMHRVNIVHRDLKSPNILLDSRMTPKITDFGLAGMGTKSLMSTLSKSTALSIGSVYWKAPEILMGKKHTTKSDIFALGIIIWEVLQGEMPFNGEDYQIVSRLITDGKKMQVSSGMDSIHKKIVNECQDMSPGKRPTAPEILQWLRNPTKSDKEYVETKIFAISPEPEPHKQKDISKEVFQERPASKISKWKIVLALLVVLTFLARFVLMVLSALYFNASRIGLGSGPEDGIAAIIAGVVTTIWIGIAILSFVLYSRKSDNWKVRALAFADIDAPRILDSSLKAHWALRLVNIILVDLFQLLFCSISMGISRAYIYISGLGYIDLSPANCGEPACNTLRSFLGILIAISFMLLVIHIYNFCKDIYTKDSQQIRN